jgi:hypothetical protein
MGPTEFRKIVMDAASCPFVHRARIGMGYTSEAICGNLPNSFPMFIQWKSTENGAPGMPTRPVLSTASGGGEDDMEAWQKVQELGWDVLSRASRL